MSQSSQKEDLMTKSQSYWVLDPPSMENESGSEDVLWNGEGFFQATMPGINCPVCGTWCRAWDIYPFPCQEKITTSIKNSRSGAYVPIEEFERYRNLVSGGDRMAYERLLPGTRLLPFQVAFPEYPVVDFMHPDTRVILVNDRVRRCFDDAEITGITWGAVDAKVHGWFDAEEDMVMPYDDSDLTPATKNKMKSAKLKDIHLLMAEVVCMPDNVEIYNRCEKCGQEEYRRTDLTREQLLDIRASIPPMRIKRNDIPASDVFRLYGTGHLCVSDRVRKVITREKMTNMGFEEIIIVD